MSLPFCKRDENVVPDMNIESIWTLETQYREKIAAGLDAETH